MAYKLVMAMKDGLHYPRELTNFIFDIMISLEHENLITKTVSAVPLSPLSAAKYFANGVAADIFLSLCNKQSTKGLAYFAPRGSIKVCSKPPTEVAAELNADNVTDVIKEYGISINSRAQKF